MAFHIYAHILLLRIVLSYLQYNQTCYDCGITSCVVYVPVDVVKERLQIQSTLQHPNGYTGSIHALRTILATEGLRGIYKVNSAVML